MKMDNLKDRISELEAEIARLKAELEKARERERNIDETRRAMLLMLQDLTESQDNLDRARHEWEATFDGISEPLFVHDRDFKIVRANRAYKDMAGGPIKEFSFESQRGVFPGRDG